MTFQTGIFWALFLAFWIVYWKSPNKYRWSILLGAGYLFYATWNISYILILAGVTSASYLTAIQLDKPNCRRKKLLFISFIILELGILFILKYVGFFTQTVNTIIRLFKLSEHLPITNIVLPIGISFYIFQTMGYVIDVYLAKVPAEKHFGYFATSIAFFPILLSGPIEKIPYIAEQLRAPKQFSVEQGELAFRKILLGFLKKMIIADGLASYVNMVYTDVYASESISLLIAILAYTIEIYCDFSGYSDTAIGIAQLLGIQLHTNFERPYLATSIKDFWRRWHISLTTWFRDYLYIPLGGNRVSNCKGRRNIFITFLLSGLWHGANWTFVIWGGIHGFLLVIEKIITKDIVKKCHPPKWTCRLLVFILVSVAWVFFRSDSIREAIYILEHCLHGLNHPLTYFSLDAVLLGMSIWQVLLLLIFIIGLFTVEYWKEKGKTIEIPKLVIFGIFEITLIYYMKFGTDVEAFIYFQF